MIFRRAVIASLTLLFPAIALSADLKVLSWNVYMLPQPIKNSLQNLRNEAIPELLIDSDYDVMFFQEAFTGSFRRAMIRKLSDQYPHHYYLKRSNMVFPVFGSGVFVMSRHPFKIIDKVRYRDCSGADCLAEKGSFLIEMKLPSGKTVQLASTHLNAEIKKPKIRKAQLQKTREMFSRASKRGVPQIFLGDLNIYADTPEFPEGLEIMQMKNLKLTGDIKTTNARVNECFKTPKKVGWIDHVWVDRATKIRGSKLRVLPTDFEYKGKTCPLSDHHAIEAKIKLN